MDFEQARKEVQERQRMLQLTRANPKGAEFKRLKKQLEKMGAIVEVHGGQVRATL